MTIQLRSAVIVSLVFMVCQFPHPGEPVDDTQVRYIPPGNYAVTSNFYETAPSVSGSVESLDTLTIFSTECACNTNSEIINKLVVDRYLFKQISDSLTLRLFVCSGLGNEGNDTAFIYGKFTRVSPDTGIYGTWQIAYRFFSSNNPLAAADSFKARNFNPGIGWLNITPAKVNTYFYKDSIPGYTTTFLMHYNSTLLKYNVRVDSISSDALNLHGVNSGDTVKISRDTSGTVKHSIILTNPTKVSLFQPNPYYYNPKIPGIVASSPTPCQDFPSWITRFLDDNKKTGE